MYLSTGKGLDGFNMFAYCGNNPVILSDSTGNCPEGFIGPCPGPDRCSYYKNQILDCPPPKSGRDLPDLPLWTTVLPDTILGGTCFYLENTYVNTNVTIDGNWIAFLPEQGITVNKYITAPKVVNGISLVLTAGTMGYEITDTWISDNNNTTEQRFIKTATIVGGTAVGVGVGYMAGAVALSCMSGGLATIPCALIYGGIILAGGIGIDQTQNMIYDYCGIE